MIQYFWPQTRCGIPAASDSDLAAATRRLASKTETSAFNAGNRRGGETGTGNWRDGGIATKASIV
jgi:hypothetical protein